MTTNMTTNMPTTTNTNMPTTTNTNMPTTTNIINLAHLFNKFSVNTTPSNVIHDTVCTGTELSAQCNATGMSDTESFSITEDDVVKPLTYGGGANTNKAGLLFEKNTCLYSLCKKIGFIDNTTYNCKSKSSTKQHNNKELTCCIKNSFKKITATKYQKDMYREPDDALIIEEPGHATKYYIIEKKEQHQSGSIDEKLFAIKYYLEDYKLNFGPEFDIKYILCVSSYLWECIVNPVNKNGKSNKWKNYKQLMASPDIFIVNGDNDYETQIKNIIPELNI